MGYINHNINSGLLFLVLMTATMLVTATVFFQAKYDQLVGEYNHQASSMNDLAGELQLHQSALTEVNSALRLAHDREAALDKITTNLAMPRPSEAVFSTPKPSPKPNPAGVTENSGFSTRPKRASTYLNGWGGIGAF